MTKKLVLTLLVLVLAVSLVAPTAMAAITEEQQKAIEEIQQKIDRLHQELVDVYLEAELITPEQAALAQKQLELRAQNRSLYSCGLGTGRGYHGRGPGGFGRGQGFGGPCFFANPQPNVN